MVPAEEYPANQYPWMNLANRGVEVRRVASRVSRVSIDDLRDAMNGRTRILSISSVEFASGYRNDLDKLGSLCRERGVYFFVDAIQSLGVLPLDVQKTPVDWIAADGHKWLLGPEGAGIFWCRRELVDLLHPTTVGWKSVVHDLDFSQIDFTLKPHAGRWEGGTLNIPGIAALGASIDLLLGIGVEAVAERVLSLTDYLCEGAERSGLRVFSSRDDGEKSGIVSLELLGDVKAIAAACRAAGVVVNRRSGRLRAEPALLQHDGRIGTIGGGDQIAHRGERGGTQRKNCICLSLRLAAPSAVKSYTSLREKPIIPNSATTAAAPKPTHAIWPSDTQSYVPCKICGNLVSTRSGVG